MRIPVIVAINLTAILLAAACSHTQSGATAALPGGGDQTMPALADEQLLAIPPKGWTLMTSSNSGKFKRAQYGRATAADVQETLTFEQMDPKDLPNPIELLESMALEQSQRCDDFHSTAVSSGLENNYPSALRLLSCPRRAVNGAASVSLAKAIQGAQGYYLIVFEKRAPARRSPTGWELNHVTEEDIATWSLYLRNARVCDSRSDQHPCPPQANGDSTP